MTELWCIRIPGPDDLFAMESKEAAEIAAVEHNKFISGWYETQIELKRELMPSLGNMLAVVERWPWSAGSHAADLLQQQSEEVINYCECGAQDCWDENELACGKCAACGGIVDA